MSNFTIPDEHVEQRIKNNLIVWLNTVRPDGRPHSAAVWYAWHEDKILIFSKPNNRKVQNLRQNPHVTLSIDNTNDGEDVITIEGTAELVEGLVMLTPAYLAKYGPVMQSYGWNVEQVASEYSQAILITPQKLLRVS